MPVKNQVRKAAITFGVISVISSVANADSIVTSNVNGQSNSINWNPNTNTAGLNISGTAVNVSGGTANVTSLNVSGQSNLSGGANVSGGASITGGASVAGGATVSGGANVSGGATVAGGMSVSGGATVSGGASIVGTTSINNNAGTSGTDIGTGSTTGNVNIGGGSGGQTVTLTGGSGGVQINQGMANGADTRINAGSGNSGNLFMGSNTSTGSVNMLSGNNSIVTNTFGNTVLGVTNINTSGNAPTTIGNVGNISPVSLISGNSNLVVGNNSVSIAAGGQLASNGSTGTGGSTGSGGFTAYNVAQPAIPKGQSVGNLLTGATYVNKISGNTLIDGDLYINGTLNYVANDSAHTTVTNGLTSGGTSIVAAGQFGKVVDANGAITGGITSQATSALTVTNSLGNTHGVVVQENRTTISGGNYSSSMMLDDSGARFSNAANGGPITVTGVADGRSEFDAVNVRQFAGAIASTTAMTNIPGVDTGKESSFGIAMGSFMGQHALAMGASYRLPGRGALKASVASGLGGGAQASMGVGAGWSW